MLCGPNKGQMFTAERYSAHWKATSRLLTSGAGGSKFPRVWAQVFLRNKYVAFGWELS